MLLRTPIDLGLAIRDQRRRLGLDQGDLAKRVGVSRKWVIDIEKGKPRAEIGLILRTINALELRLWLDMDRPAISDRHAERAAVPFVDIDGVLDRARGDR